MTADVLSFERGCALLRGHDADQARKRRIQVVRQGAFRRAVAGEYSKADKAMFGPVEQLLEAGPGVDPRLTQPIGGGPAVA